MKLIALVTMLVSLTKCHGDCGDGDCTGVVTINHHQLEGECLAGVSGDRWCYVQRKSGCSKRRYRGRFISEEACHGRASTAASLETLSRIKPLEPGKKQEKEVCKTVDGNVCNFPLSAYCQFLFFVMW